MQSENMGKRLGKILYKGRWFWLIGVLSLFVLNFVILYNVQKAVQDTATAEGRLKEKAQKIDIMWQEIRQKQKDAEEIETELRERDAKLSQKEAELEECKKRAEQGGIFQEKFEPLQESNAPTQDVGGKGGIPIYNITERLSMLTDEDQIVKEASEWLKKKITEVQNPKDCENAKYMYCPISNSCGGGCVIHQLAYCMVVGFATNRVTVIADGFRYLKDCPNGVATWTCMFEPMTRCPESLGMGGETWSEDLEKRGERNARVDMFSRSNYNRNYYPWAASDGFHTKTPFYLPPEIESVMRKIHGDPRVWLVGHLEQYMLRFNKDALRDIKDLNKEVIAQWRNPIAGVHVRRTDHRVEAPFRELSEYMDHVKKWFKDREHTGDKYVYIASDEPAVIAEAEANYPDYKFLYHKQGDIISGAINGNQNIQNDRASMGGTLSLLSDWYFLQRVDFLVGTSSSQVTRMAYELMQYYHTDASKLFVSLDDPWYFP